MRIIAASMLQMDYFTLEEINLMSPQNCLARLVSCQW